MSLRCAALLLALPGMGAAQRVLLISLDGFGQQALVEEMPALKRVIERGVRLSMQTAFPSTTANSHVVLATGAWGDVNGIHANSHPVMPRREHTSFERGDGYRAKGLTAEPIWAAAARQGVRSVVVNAVPTFPFLPTNAPPGLPLAVVNYYQTKLVAPHRALSPADMLSIPCETWKESALPRKCFYWSEGDVAFHASLGASKASGYDHMDVSVEPGGPEVRAWLAPTEDAPPRGRALARHFSDGLAIGEPPDAVVYFRLFEASAGSFLLFRSAVRELAITDAALRSRILREAGGVFGNGHAEWNRARDSLTHRRALEVLELGMRQQSRVQQWLWREWKPGFLFGYFSAADEADHQWLAAPPLENTRQWVYAALDAALEPLIATLEPTDHIVFVSDHGMGVTEKLVRVAPVLERAGLMARTPGRELDTERSKMSLLYNCAVVNTRDWKGGIVPLGERDTVIATAARLLRELKDPETGLAVMAQVLTSEKDKAKFGFGGHAGADFCFDPAPGYYVENSFAAPVVEKLAVPRGNHGGSPLRRDMRSTFIAAGPRIAKGRPWPEMRAIDVAPLIARLLGISPPLDSRGSNAALPLPSPLQSQ